MLGSVIRRPSNIMPCFQDRRRPVVIPQTVGNSHMLSVQFICPTSTAHDDNTVELSLSICIQFFVSRNTSQKFDLWFYTRLHMVLCCCAVAAGDQMVNASFQSITLISEPLKKMSPKPSASLPTLQISPCLQFAYCCVSNHHGWRQSQTF
jgi:hypothetical protein